MLRKYVSYYSYRNISKSIVSRNLEKSKPSETVSPSPTSISQDHQLFDFTPTKYHKRILLLSGRYKSEKDIPDKISYEIFGNARSKLRIKISNLLIVLTLGLFGFCIWYGKKRRSEGDSILSRMLKKDREILASYAEEKNKKT